MEMGGGTKDALNCIKNCLITRPVLGYEIGVVLAQIQPLPQSADLVESDGQDLHESDGVEVVKATTPLNI
ncbi:hypothetical protein OUZ56_017294 [Daphnia magna]|uniref:Uncharacterized protein n=1 Tax=Daphnia magna TaxID=35525 RepID=A0ABR0ASP2_9CRUS|nr:hypothetical protein OUZ56_017294 [Daphnia magna]